MVACDGLKMTNKCHKTPMKLYLIKCELYDKSLYEIHISSCI